MDDLSRIGTPSGLPKTMLVGFLDAVPASAAILDRQANIVAVNAAWRRFSSENCGTNDNWVGLNYLRITEMAEDGNANTVAAGLRAVLEGGEPSFQHDYPCDSQTEARWFRCLISPLTEDGVVIGAAVMHLDITAQVIAERRALAASQAKSEFLARLSHELRTPLNAVIGFSEMLMMEVWGPLGGERYKGYAGDIHVAGKHLLSLINEVLDLSKVEAGRFELRDEIVALCEVVPQCMGLLAERANRAGITLSANLPDTMPSLRADPRVLRQILLNLLSNAVKFTPAGGQVITSARVTDDGWLALAVADTGIGIAASDFARVLEPFGQVDSEQARLHSGQSTGLGLPLTRRFAELHDGKLVLESEMGKGTVVMALFPPERVRF